jgi:hypothetical protein
MPETRTARYDELVQAMTTLSDGGGSDDGQ